MKRKIAVVLLMLFVISCFLMTLTACEFKNNNDDTTDVGGSNDTDNIDDSGNTNNDGNTEQGKCVPVYQGMTITNSNTALSLTDASYRYDEVTLLSSNNENNGNNGNHYGHYKGDHADNDHVIDQENPYPDNSDSENIEEEIKSSLNVIGATNELYYATSNQDIYINIHIHNPDNFEILSFTLNGKKYSSYMFEEGSDMETIVLKYNVGAVSGIVEYTIDAIKYIDGTEIKDVIIDGDKTVKAGVKTDNQLTASISGVDIDTNALSFNANISDSDNLIAFSNGALKAVIYDGAEIVAQKDLTVGENSITFDNLKTNTLYQYAVVGYYDDFSGNGFGMNVLYKDAFYTDAVVLFDSITIEQDSISFGYIWHEDHQGKAISTLKLYKDGAFVMDVTASSMSVSGLLLDTTYTIVAEYPNGNNTESIYLEFTTLAKAVPEISVVSPTKTHTSVGFEIAENDTDNIGAVAKIELYKGNELVMTADNLTAREFTGLLSNNTYTVKVTYVYNLNDGEGEHTVTKELDITTLKKNIPQVEINNVEIKFFNISADCEFIDIDSVLCSYSAELYKDEDLIAQNTNGTIMFEFFENSKYTVSILYTYDLNDGTGIQTAVYSKDIYTDFTITIDSRTLIGYTGEMNESLVIPDVFEHNGAWYGVTNIGNYAFYGCNSLTSITIPDSVTSIGDYAFYGCTSLTQINFNATEMNDLSSSNYAFADAGKNGNGIKVVIGKNVTKIPAYLFCPYSFSYSPKIVSVEFEEGSVCENIGDRAFYYCTKLTSVTIGNGVTNIGNSAFSECTSLTSVTIPDNVTSIGDYAFECCTSLTSVTIGNSVTSIGGSAFSGCSLTSVVIPDSVISIGGGAFAYCTSLTSVTIGDSVTGIGSEAFYGCTSLTSVTIPDNVTSIDYYAFENCTSLTNVTIGNGVTSIDEMVFDNCSSLTSVIIGTSVTYINGSAFWGCTSRVSIKYRGTEAQWNAIDKGYDWDYDLRYTITYNYTGE